MASTDNEVPAPIIVKKIKKGGGGHHGGAWKVAYADFVTAMMAFFLLMWLLNVTTDEEKNAISNYFDPTHPKVSQSESGSGGILGGLTVTFDGAMTSDKAPPTTPPDARTPQTGDDLGKQRDRQGTSEYEGDTYDRAIQGEDRDLLDRNDDDSIKDGINILDEIEQMKQAEIAELRKKLEDQQDKVFEDIQKQILEEIEKTPELADLKDHLIIDITPEGLRIQIVDKEGRSMFPSGKAGMFGFMQALVAKVTQIIKLQPNQISIRGHTDGVPYPPEALYDNWNLSSDRALATRRVIVGEGLPETRIETVVGRADREHLLPDEPLSPRNRRISIVLLREKLLNDQAVRDAADKAGLTKENKNVISTDDTPESSQDTSSPAVMREDRENIPELDQTVQESKPPKIVDENELGSGTSTTDIVDEIRKFQEQKAQRSQIQPDNSPPPKNNTDPSYLEF